MKRPGPGLLLAVTIAAAAACGTTVPLSGQQAIGSANGLGPGDPAAPGAPLASLPPGAPLVQPTSGPGLKSGLQLPGGTSQAPSGKTQPAGIPRGSSNSPTTAIPLKGPGWDAKNVYVGIITAKDAATGLQALGVSLNPGDEAGDAHAVVADLNAKGGLFGRKVVLVIKDDASATVLSNPSSAGQADCAYFAQDHPVISVVNTDASLDLDSFRACFKKARIPLVTVTTAAFDDAAANSLSPFFYNALSVSWNRLIPVLVSRLAMEGYFTGWNSATGTAANGTKPKVGVLYGGDSTGTRVGPALVAALKRAGYATDSFQYGSTSDGSAAELKFAGDGVTHVIGIDTFQFFFMTAARSQHYLPRYGVTSYNGLQALLVSNGDKSQLNGALGVGWYPTLDTEQAQDPGPGPGTSDCLAGLKAGGQTFSGKRFAQAVGMAICDGLRLGVLGAKSGAGLDPASIRRGIVALGPAFPTGGSFASGLSATNYAMPGAGRDVGWDSHCQCFAYTGTTYRIG